jgi:DNA-binding response OmpR family regulator
MSNDGRILLVDDEQDITFALSVGLEDNGFLVDTFNDPRLRRSKIRTTATNPMLWHFWISKCQK